MGSAATRPGAAPAAGPGHRGHRWDGLRVRDAMRPPVAVVDAARTLGEAAALLRATRVRHLPVTAAGRLVGVLDLRTAWACARRSAEELAAPVGACVPRTVPRADVDAPLEAAARALRDSGGEVLVAVDGRGAVQGLVTLVDLVTVPDRR